MDDIQLIINIEELELWSVGKPEVKYKVRDNYLKQGLAPLDQSRGELNSPNMQASCLLAFLAVSSTCHGKSEIK